MPRFSHWLQEIIAGKFDPDEMTVTGIEAGVARRWRHCRSIT